MRESIIELPTILIPDEAIEILYREYIQPVFDYSEVSRKLAYHYPVEALRELIINSLVHKNYRVREPVTIRVFEDRVQIFCFGGLPEGWTAETLLKEHDSVRRNEVLAAVFHDAGYMENWAQGIDKVLRECRENGNPEPIFTPRLGGLRVTVFSNASKKMPAVQPEFVPDNNSELIPISDRQRAIIRAIAANPYITINGISNVTGLSSSTIDYNLSRLTKAGIVTRIGSDKSGKRGINPAYLPNDESDSS